MKKKNLQSSVPSKALIDLREIYQCKGIGLLPL